MRFVVVLLFLTALVLGSMYLQKPATLSPTKQTNEEQTPSSFANATVTLGDATYSVYWQNINANNLSLIPNFDEKKSATTIIEENNCIYGVNGGFYSQEYTPLGLFVANGEELSNVRTNRTLNGFFVKDDGGLWISTQPPTNDVVFALQSGPYMTPTTMIRIQNDELTRRILVARSGDQWYFLAITDQDNTFNGPFLSDVPDILEKLPIDVSGALNLDGGSASAFYSESGTRLGELTPVGSFFCGK